jgi:hypothetical protein
LKVQYLILLNIIFICYDTTDIHRDVSRERR